MLEIFVAAAMAAGAVGQAASTTPDGSALLGSWRAETYTMKEGARHTVDGLIFFTRNDWSIVFFVVGDAKVPRRGAAEAGTYTADHRKLVFTHLYHLSSGEAIAGLPASALRMEMNDPSKAPTEPCTYTIDGDSLRIDFPSGNAMTFRRSETP